MSERIELTAGQVLRIQGAGVRLGSLRERHAEAIQAVGQAQADLDAAIATVVTDDGEPGWYDLETEDEKVFLVKRTETEDA